jgi:chemotaxis protein MotD
VTAHIRAAGDALEVEIAAETTEAHKHLAAEADDILRSLRQVGIDVDKVTVHLTSNDANAKNPSGQEWRNFSSFQGQDRREGETSQRGRNGGGTGGETVTGALGGESRASEVAGRYI